MRTHKDLDVWKDGIGFVTEIYKITTSFPKEEMYGITSQIRRAAISIPSNIAEERELPENLSANSVNFYTLHFPVLLN
jgi:four helix bundle protein